jgi:hypothetical protein
MSDMGTINTTKLILNQAIKMAEEKSIEPVVDKNSENFSMAKKVLLTTNNISMVKKSQAEKKVIRDARNITKSQKSLKNNTKSRSKKDK